MPDHLHLVVRVPLNRRLSRFMQLVKGRFAKEHNDRCGQSGSFWQDRYHERALRSETQLNTALSYVYYNPVAEGIVTHPEDYRWVYAEGLSGQAEA